MTAVEPPTYPFLQWDVAAADADERSAWLFELDALGVEQRDDNTMSRGPGKGQVRLIVSFASDQAASQAAEVVRQAYPAAKLQLDQWVGDAWRDKYKEHFAPFAITPEITLAPPWVDFDELDLGSEQIVLWMDPGRAFGTGLHATTSMVAGLLHEHRARLDGCRLLDVGTGSGILAFCSLLLGARSVRAIDNDPDVIAVVHDNARRNGRRLVADDAPLASITGRYDVVVANIRSSVLMTMAADLAARCASGGLLLLSGILATERVELQLCFEQAGFVLVGDCERREKAAPDAWVALAMERRDPLRAPLQGLREGDLPLPKELRHYLEDVRRLKPGDPVLLFDAVEKQEARAILLAGGRVRASAPTKTMRLAQQQLSVLQAAGKGSKVDHVLRDATELGVTRFVVLTSERSVSRPAEKKSERWRRVALEAARQCGRGDVPEVLGPLGLAEALQLASDCGRRLVLQPGGQPLIACLEEQCADGGTAILIGPEGGFSQAEIDLAEAAGFCQASLGSFVLRTETACAAALGALSAFADKETALSDKEG